MSIKTTSNSKGPLTLILIGLALILGLALWLAITQSNPKNPSKVQVNGTVERTTLVQAKQSYDNHSALFLDVRDLEFYNESHLSGAVNIPYGELDARYRQLDPNRWIITYCT